MTSATTSHARGARQGEGYGMIVFAVALLVTVGFFNVCAYGSRENLTA